MKSPFKLRVVRLDHDGYNGRDHFAEDSDVGTEVVPLQMVGYWFHPEGEEYHLLVDGGMAANATHCLDQENHEIMWTCITSDGRTVELMNHEVEVA